MRPLRNLFFGMMGTFCILSSIRPGEERFYLARVEWDLTDFTLPMQEFAAKFDPIANRFSMHWRLAVSTQRTRVAIFVSSSITVWWICCTGTAMASWSATFR